MDNPAKQLELLMLNYLRDDASLHTALPFVLRTVSAHNLLLRVSETIADLGEDNANVTKDSPGARAVSALHKWSTRITALLSAKSAVVQWSGCCLVRASVAQSPGAFQKDMRGWCNALLAAAGKIDDAFASDVADAATELILASKAFPALQRDLNQMYLAKLVARMCDRVGQGNVSLTPFLRNIRALLRAFSNGLRSQSERIEILCLQTIATPSATAETVGLATGCLLDLVRIDKESAAKGGESKVLDKILASVDEVVDAMFSSVEDARTKDEGAPVGLVLPVVDGEYHAQVLARVAQLDALAACLCRVIADMKTGFSARKVIDLIRRIYSVTTRVNLQNRGDSDGLLLSMVLPTTCVKANDVLCILLSRNLVRDLRFVSTICSKSLEFSHNHTALRMSAYHLIGVAIDTFDCDFVKLSLDGLAKAIILDIQLDGQANRRATQPLVAQPQNKKRKLQVSDSTQDDAAPINWDLKFTALTTLERLILFGQPHVVSLDLHGPLRAVLAALLGSATAKLLPSASTTSTCGPFSSPLAAYQHALLRCTLAGIEAGVGRAAADILPVGARIIAAMLHHPDLRVRDLCRRAAVVVDLVIHPRLPRFEYAPVAVPAVHLSPLENVPRPETPGKRRLEEADREEDVRHSISATTSSANRDAVFAPPSPAAAPAIVESVAVMTTTTTTRLTEFLSVPHEESPAATPTGTDEEEEEDLPIPHRTQRNDPVVPMDMDSAGEDDNDDGELPEINIDEDDDEEDESE
ncbi:hypothetical protein HDU87_001054 [Geranomyces variabilis]|uniref:Pre-rRNA-processing protein RIX1 n=1 Tax=Geranomyces variabilis TaxID=109894 RepID=A0AAD5TMV7_9FUNG|nr:hypothetical protein HDU87_001054 [Geranomyces variabilis]